MKNKAARQTGKFDYVVLAALLVLSFLASNVFVHSPSGVHLYSVSTAFTVATAVILGKRSLPVLFLADAALEHILGQNHILISVFTFLILFLILDIRDRIERKNGGPLSHTTQAGLLLFGCSLALPFIIASLSCGIARLLSLPDIIYQTGWLQLSGDALAVITLTPPFYLILSKLLKQENSIPNHYLVCRKEIYQNPIRLAVTTAGYCAFIYYLAGHPLDLQGFQLMVVALPILCSIMNPFGYLFSMTVLASLTAVAVHQGLPLYESGILGAPAIFLGKVQGNERIFTYEVVFFSLSALFLLFCAKSLDQRIAEEQARGRAVRQARRDPLTGFDNIDQLRLDLEKNGPVILVLLNISKKQNLFDTLSFEGNQQLLIRLGHYVRKHINLPVSIYQMPFSCGLLLLVPNNADASSSLKYLGAGLKNYRFDWSGSSIEIFDGNLHCFSLSSKEDKKQLESALGDLNRSARLCKSPAGKVVWLTENPNKPGITRLRDLGLLQEAFKQDQLILFAQAYRRLDQDDDRDFFEVLVRLEDDLGAILPPAKFFPLIEEFNMQEALDHRVINNALAQIGLHYKGKWERLGHCAINLSPLSVGNPSIIQFIRDRIGHYAVPADKLVFEITENAALENDEATCQVITALQELGCQVALDDFGIGYASYDYLRRLPVDTVKIDGSFVQNIVYNKVDESIVRSVHQVATLKGINTVAEFVTTEEQIRLLKEIGVHYGQGFGIAKPLPLKTLLDSRVPLVPATIPPSFC